jgi:hypothetical protein
MAQNTNFQQNTIFLRNDDFKILRYAKDGLDIEIIQEDKIKEIVKAKKPIFCFYIEGRKYIAKGNDILKSSVPENCDYFYLIKKQGDVLLIKNKLSFIKVR